MSALDQLRGFVQTNRTALAIAGAGVVGGYALTQGRKRDSGSSGGGLLPPRASTSGGAAATIPAGFAMADTTSTDLYASIQPQIEYLQRLTEQQQGAPIPVPGPAPAAGLKAGFYKMAGTQNLYQITSTGRIDYLTRDEFRSIAGKTKPKVTTISGDNPVFQNGAHWLDARKQQPAGNTAAAVASATLS